MRPLIIFEYIPTARVSRLSPNGAREMLESLATNFFRSERSVRCLDSNAAGYFNVVAIPGKLHESAFWWTRM